MTRQYFIEANSPAAMEHLGRTMAQLLSEVRTIYLRGELGAGKTTLVRGILRGYGYDGPVKSPTFTLIESYPLNDRVLHHFDLYRLEQPSELEDLGWREYFTDADICLIEWPERAGELLPQPCLDVIIRKTRLGRTVELVPHNTASERLAAKMYEEDLL